MTRIPLLQRDCREPAELLQAIRARRGGELLNLDRTLLQSVPLAAAWNDYLKVIRTGLAVPPLLRELVMCGVAVLNGAEYEFTQHAPEFIRAGGSSSAASKLRDFVTAAQDEDTFDEVQRAVMGLTLAMTRDVKVDAATWSRFHSAIPEPRLQVEIIGVIATYNMVSRFLVACDVEPEG